MVATLKWVQTMTTAHMISQGSQPCHSGTLACGELGSFDWHHQGIFRAGRGLPYAQEQHRRDQRRARRNHVGQLIAQIVRREELAHARRRHRATSSTGNSARTDFSRHTWPMT